MWIQRIRFYTFKRDITPYIEIIRNEGEFYCINRIKQLAKIHICAKVVIIFYDKGSDTSIDKTIYIEE